MSEQRFNLGQHGIYYANVATMNPYEMVSNAYNGDGIIMDGSALIPFSRETFYTERKALSSYRNYLKPIVNSLIEPVFNEPIMRESNSELFDSFLEDVDNKGTKIDSNSLDVVTLARLHGVTFVVMDNFDTNEIPPTVNEVISQRKFPYIYTQPANTVKTFKTDDFGNLLSITFNNADVIIEGKTYKVTVTWDKMSMIKEIWEGGKIFKSIVNVHGLGVIPVISLYSTNRDKILPIPPFYDLAKMNITLFNKDSELRDQSRAQAFSVFYAQMDTNNSNLTIGPHAAIVLPLDPSLTITPGYTSPDASILEHLMKSNNEIVDSLYQMAGQNGIIGIKSVGSGIAESYKFKSSSNQLKRTAYIAEEYEEALANLFSLYVKTPIEYKVAYTTNYDAFYTQLTIDDFTKIDKLMLPNEVKKEFIKVMIHTYLDNLNKERLSELDLLIDNSLSASDKPINNQQSTIDNS